MKYTRQAGYTLIELLLYSVISATLLLATVSFFAIAVGAQTKNQTIEEVNQQGQAAIDYIAQTVRNADSITLPAAAAGSNSLTLAVPTASLSPTVFNLSGTTLQVKEGAAAAISLTNSKVQITSLTFTNLSRSGTAGAVRISITVARANPANRTEYDYQRTFNTTVTLR